jgi:hypothetical protein
MKRKPSAVAQSLFSLEQTIPSAELARVPANAENFDIPVNARTVLQLQKKHNGYGKALMIEAFQGLDAERRICSVNRAWLRSADRYMQEGGRGGMQLRLRACWPDFRAYAYTVLKEDAAADRKSVAAVHP